MSNKISTVATFLAGLAVGAGMLYLAPPANEGGGMGGPPGGGGPPGEGGMGGPPGGMGGPPGGMGGPPGGPPGGGSGLAIDWVDTHLDKVPDLWEAASKASKGAGQDALAARAEELSRTAPGGDSDLPPPLPEVAVYVNAEVTLARELSAAGVDVADLERELAPLME